MLDGVYSEQAGQKKSQGFCCVMYVIDAYIVVYE